jgi:hypothetical protein
MADTVACDVSYFQPVVDDTYPHRWLIFRCCDGNFADPNCDTNARWAVNAVKAGRMDGWTAYVVWRPGLNANVLAHVKGLPAGGYVMVDVESWGGQISGNHSTEINVLVRALQQLRPGRVWVYGNRGDLASIYPNRGTIPVVVASYGGSKPTDVANMIGWQYTDGTHAVAGLRSSTPPFGACDHNVLYLTAEHTESGSSIQLGSFLMALSDKEQAEVLLAARQWNKRFAKFDLLSAAILGWPAAAGRPVANGIRTILSRLAK